ncbi:hypothetical protein D3C78_722440 [compost metagenome]
MARARRTPARKAGSAAGRISRVISKRRGSLSTAAASRRRGCASRTPTRVCRVTGTMIALTSTTSLSSSPMPNSTMNNGTQASVGICARALKVGSTRRSARRLQPSQAPSRAPLLTPTDKPISKRCRLIARCAHNSPWASSCALCQTRLGAGSICSLIHWLRLASHHSRARASGRYQAWRRACNGVPAVCRRLAGAARGRLGSDARAMADLRGLAISIFHSGIFF